MSVVVTNASTSCLCCKHEGLQHKVSKSSKSCKLFFADIFFPKITLSMLTFVFDLIFKPTANNTIP